MHPRAAFKSHVPASNDSLEQTGAADRSTAARATPWSPRGSVQALCVGHSSFLDKESK